LIYVPVAADETAQRRNVSIDVQNHFSPQNTVSHVEYSSRRPSGSSHSGSTTTVWKTFWTAPDWLQVGQSRPECDTRPPHSAAIVFAGALNLPYQLMFLSLGNVCRAKHGRDVVIGIEEK